MKNVDFYYDYGSPASYIAYTQIETLCQKYDATVTYKPMVLGAVFKATGNSSPVMIPAKAKYIMMDFVRSAKIWGIPFRLNKFFPIFTLNHMRMGAAVQQHMPNRFQAFNKAMFEAIWLKELDMNNPEVIAQVITDAGFDPQQILALSEDAAVRDYLRANTDEAVSIGVFGAPTMIYNGEMFFGQDRLNVLEMRLANSSRYCRAFCQAT